MVTTGEEIKIMSCSAFFIGRTSLFCLAKFRIFKNYYLKYPIAFFNYASDCASFDDKPRFSKSNFQKFFLYIII